MAKIHVYPLDKGWAVRRTASQASKIFPTQKEAIEKGRSLAKHAAPSQMVVLGRNGMIRGYTTYGLPKVQDPPIKSPNSKKIEMAVGRVMLERLISEERRHRDQRAEK